MEITVTGRKMPITDALKSYAEEKIGNSMKVFELSRSGLLGCGMESRVATRHHRCYHQV